MVMSCGGEDKQWSCGGSVNLHKLGSIVRDIGEPCLSQSPIKVNKMLKPDMWQSTFDGDGRAYGFWKALKIIILGGVDPSIRGVVWEFLLGCYELGSTAEYRRQLRTARREHYEDLIKQCQTMHSSIGTGSLAYVVGSKVLDMRTSSKDDRRGESDSGSGETSIDNTNRVENFCTKNNNYTDSSYNCQRESSSDSADLVSVRESTDSAAYGSSCYVPTSGPCDCNPLKLGSGADGAQCVTDNYYDFPPLPITDLFDKSGDDKKEHMVDDVKLSAQNNVRFGDGSMHTFQINNNEELIIESNGSLSNKSEIEVASVGVHDSEFQSNSIRKKDKLLNRLRISDVPETEFLNATTSHCGIASEDRVSEWLWTLHQIVVDVVRTDSHLEFYEDTRNLARMSDILAVYAWVDPSTGYCQGMSDLLSPFVYLFEDDADAFWCFEMLLRRMRENFQMEGPTGVMKQLEVLWNIMELTDREMFAHLSKIGAESLHFAFRMLLVLFRRELSFNEALCMWEMMWAADFDESLAYSLAGDCLQQLVVQLPRGSTVETIEESSANGNSSIKSILQSSPENVEHSMNENVGIESASAHPFCGLTRNLWPRNDCMQKCTLPMGSTVETIEESSANGNSSIKSILQSSPENVEHSTNETVGIELASAHPFCGLTRNLWSRNDCIQKCTAVSSTVKGNNDLPVFCVAAILIINRQMIIRKTRSIDDMIKIFNDKMLKINIKRCIRTAIKLRKKYLYKLIKKRSSLPPNED